MPIYKQLQNKITFYRTFSIVMIALVVFIGINNQRTTEYTEKLEKRIDKDETIMYALLTFADYSINRIGELESANGALMRNASHKSCVKAIKATPLPKLEKQK